MADAPGRWLGPWMLYVLDDRQCEWKRAFQNPAVPGAVYVRRGPMVPNPNGQRWGHPRTARWMP